MNGELPYYTKGAGTRLTIFKLDGHDSLGRLPHQLLTTFKGFMPHDDGILAWRKGGLGGATGRRPTPKGVLSTHRESWDLPAFPAYQAKGEKTHDKKRQIHDGIAGGLITAGVAFGYYVDPLWLLLPGILGVTLLQSGFTGFCPVYYILDRTCPNE